MLMSLFDQVDDICRIQRDYTDHFTLSKEDVLCWKIKPREKVFTK